MSKGYRDRWPVTWEICDDDEEKSVVITPESFYLNFIPSCLLTFNMSIYRQSVPKTF